MMDWFGSVFLEVLFLFLCIAPILFLWQTVFAGKYMSTYHKIGIWLFGFYIVGLIAFTGISPLFFGNLHFSPYYNTELFVDIFVSPHQYILNILLFVPLGFLTPLLWKKFRSQNKILLLGFCSSFAIEFLQMFCNRTTDVDDLLANTMGALCSYWLFLIAKQKIAFYQFAYQIQTQ